MLPAGVWADGNNGLIQFENTDALMYLTTVFGSISSDFLAKLPGGAKRTLSQISSIPIPDYYSSYSDEAMMLYKQGSPSDTKDSFNHILPRVDALIWLHFGLNNSTLNRNSLAWMLESQFSTLNKKFPEYRELVLGFFDHYKKQINQKNKIRPNVFGTVINEHRVKQETA
jgi:hypothetical protein